MKAKILNIGINVGKKPFISGYSFDIYSGKLIIQYNPDTDGKMINIVFKDHRGFRCLDELDLTEYWEDDFIVNNWFFEVIEGGWMDLESKRRGFLSKEIGHKEYFICGTDYCVNVISNQPPIIENANAA